jgi:hypothetical protein
LTLIDFNRNWSGVKMPADRKTRLTQPILTIATIGSSVGKRLGFIAHNANPQLKLGFGVVGGIILDLGL